MCTSTPSSYITHHWAKVQAVGNILYNEIFEFPHHNSFLNFNVNTKVHIIMSNCYKTSFVHCRGWFTYYRLQFLTVTIVLTKTIGWKI